jgi:glycosyltransferase involved in cell wall biosynthesis
VPEGVSVPRRKVAFFQRVFARYQSGLVRELAARSCNAFTFFSDDRDPLGSGIEPLGSLVRSEIPFVPCRTFHLGRHVAFQPRAVLTAITGDFDVLILEGICWHPTAWIAAICARLRRKRVLLYTHGWKRAEKGLVRTVRIAFYRLADGLLLYGDRARQIGIREGFAADRMYVVSNCLEEEPGPNACTIPECEERRAILSPFFTSTERPVVLSVGRLVPQKELPLLLKAVRSLGNQGMALNVLFVGDGPERSKLISLAADLRLAVGFTGAEYDPAALARYFACANVTVSPGSIGLTAVQSLAHATPVITHDRLDSQGPEVEAILPGVNGVLFTDGDVESLARAIKQVVTEMPKNPDTMSRCRTVVDERFNAVSMRRVFDAAVAGLPPSETAQPTATPLGAKSLATFDEAPVRAQTPGSEANP